MLLDSTFNIATPEGVELKLPVAGLAPRALAWLIDAMIKLAIMFAIGILLAFLGEFGGAIYLLGAFFLLWLYNVIFEVLFNGATPGKKVVGLRVMNANGTPVGWSGSLLRNLIRFVDTLPGCYLFGCCSVLLSRNFQRLGDLAANTVVVYQPKHTNRGVAQLAPPIPVTVPLTLDEQQSLVSFGERVGGLNKQRAEELASLLEPVFGDIDRERLSGYASWLGGKRADP